MTEKELKEQSMHLKQGYDSEKDDTVEEPPTFRERMTLEPLWGGVTISMTMGSFAFKNLFLERACMVDLGYSEEVCLRSEGELRESVERETQRIVSSLMVSGGFIAGFITSVLLIFLGPWSDKSGRRKPLIILPICGMFFTSLCMLIVQAFPELSTTWVVFAEIIPLALGGNFTMLIMAGFNYLGDICYKTKRCPTVVMGWNTGFLSLFMIIGSMAGPFLYRAVGYIGVFSISLVLELTSLFFAIYKVNDINVSLKVPNVLDIKLPLEVVKCVFKKRDGNKRRIIFLMIIVPCCNSMIYIAEMSLTYLYVRNKFNWTEVEYGTYIGVKSIIHTIGTFIIVSIFKKRFKMPERYIGIIGGFSQIIGPIAFMFSTNSYALFGTIIFGILSRGAMIAERPILNKQIQANEQGKVNCLTCVLEKIVSFFIVPLANYIYSVTLSWMPSSYILLSAVAGVLQIVCYALVNKEKKEIEMENKKLPDI